MTGWEIALLAGGGTIAVLTLTRLMAARRDALIHDLNRRVTEVAEAKVQSDKPADKKGAAPKA